MTERLAINHFFIQAEELSTQIIQDIQKLEEDKDLVVLPEPTLEVLEQYNAAPDDLLNAGEDVPSDEDDAIEFAIEQFRFSDSFYEWQNGLRPGEGLEFLWPLEPVPSFVDETDPDYVPFDHQGLANKLLENHLNCCYVNGEHQGRRYQGFILTGGNMNLADELAMAYVLAGFVPPHGLLHDAVTNTRNDDWKETFLDCLERGREYMQWQADFYKETLDMYRPTRPSLT
jgi:hypothetical protein